MTDQEKQFIDDCHYELKGISELLKTVDYAKERLRVLGIRLDSYSFHKRKGLNYPWPEAMGLQCLPVKKE